MKALFYPEFQKLTVTERPAPAFSENEVLLRVLACGICGSELETFKSQSPRRVPPLIMGHEFCGMIEEIGAAVSGYQKGDLVASNSVVSCGTCDPCRRGLTNLCRNRQIFGMHREGAFGQYVNVPAHCLVPLSGNVTPQAACMAEPLANGIHMVNLSKHLLPQKVLVIGAGPIGLVTQQAFQSLLGVEVYVADLRSERLTIASRLGAAATINSSEENLVSVIQRLTEEEGIDLVIDAVGTAQTNQQALQCIRPGGAIVLIGLYENSQPFFSYDIILSEKQIIGTYAATQKEIQESLELIASGKVDVTSWVHYYSLDDGVAAFRDMMAAKDTHIKSVIVF
ncbi:2-dehydro-3-deoxy-L-rhamnonate dehydrogenase (NAD(+)) [Dyadobacter sp. CECT 9275]|uniref:2-dehydro-3-deoxy-L-rhamnonate dehydrogenase (NAD(+)) n=1 Tax=Dyadobacter helix TaxID=2822344 RepID=A0A916JE53_9BACT|nr:alcohol dehydrogenase catalytic domain-containing protein [Dyadobacter sp. CECT 9275]CAG5006281.1 2-dehydro-3-deoxy-L-rhamnonate dehydrogenase (NAD(+)) [Dyadobacter sp. CECT 9275]